MSSRIDPVGTIRRRQRGVDVIGGMAVLAAVLWAASPIQQYEPETRPPAALSAGSPVAIEKAGRVPVEPFGAVLWHEPAEPIVAPVIRPPPAPKLLLVAISIVDGVYRAVIQDDDAGELRTVHAGDGFGVTSVISIEPGVVRLEAHGQQFELSLDRGTP